MKQICLLYVILSFLMFSCNTSEKDKQLDNLKSDVEKLKDLNKKLESKNIELAKENSELELKLNEFPEVYSNEDFWGFFRNFMTDSTFQISRIKFPLDYVTWQELPNGDIDLGGETVTIKIDINKWEYESFYINTASERTQVYDNFNLKFQPSNERVLHWFGVETGGDAKYFFEGFNGKWHLVKKVQLGD